MNSGMKTSKSRSKPAKSKNKWREVLITVFAIVALSTTVIFIIYRIYSQETLSPIGKQIIVLPLQGTILEHNKICMASNVYLGQDQMAITIAGRQYFSCSSHCTKQLQSGDSVRLAVDPYSKTVVDKSSAFITMSPGRSQTILYFETEENIKKYLSK